MLNIKYHLFQICYEIKVFFLEHLEYIWAHNFFQQKNKTYSKGLLTVTANYFCIIFYSF